MLKERKKEAGIPFTHEDAQVFRDLFDVLEGVYGDGAQSYFQALR